MAYIKTILLKCQQIMHVNTRLLKTLPRCKMKISSHLIDFQEPINVASLTFFIFNPLEKSLSFALNVTCKSENKTIIRINENIFVVICYSRRADAMILDWYTTRSHQFTYGMRNLKTDKHKTTLRHAATQHKNIACSSNLEVFPGNTSTQNS